MKRIDVYITEEQDNILESYKKDGLNKSFLIRRAVNMMIDNQKLTVPPVIETKTTEDK